MAEGSEPSRQLVRALMLRLWAGVPVSCLIPIPAAAFWKLPRCLCSADNEHQVYLWQNSRHRSPTGKNNLWNSASVGSDVDASHIKAAWKRSCIETWRASFTSACLSVFDPGNGEQGKAFPLTDSDRVDQAYRENGFNIYISDRISLNRSIPDIRHAKWVPPTCFHNSTMHFLSIE